MKLSIIIPTYNNSALLKRALDSIPFDEDLEVIVVNDGSTDDTKELLKNYNVKAVNFTENKGTRIARNTGMDLMSGEYMIHLDDDDYFHTDELRKAIKELDGTDLVYIDLTVNSGDVWELNPSSRLVLCAFWSKFVRTEFMGDLRSIDDEGRLDGDLYFTKDLIKMNPTEKYTHIVAYHYNHPRVGSQLWKKQHGS